MKMTKLLMTTKLLSVLVAILCLAACSSNSSEDFSEVDAQRAYNDLKGTYVGNVLVENIPTSVSVIIGSDFSVRYIPVNSLLARVFTDDAQLQAAIKSAGAVTFNAPVVNMAVSGDQLLLSMEPTDLVFNVVVDGQTYTVAALMTATVLYNHSFDTLSLNIAVDELSCNGTTYDLSQNGITYFIDTAQRQ